MKKTLFIATFFIFGLAKSQTNIVDNYSFEVTYSGYQGGACPNNDYYDDQLPYWNNVVSWTLPAKKDICIDTDAVGSSDCYNTGGHTGNNVGFCGDGEYICANLNATMSEGKTYYVEFYVYSGGSPYTSNGGIKLSAHRPKQCAGHGIDFGNNNPTSLIEIPNSVNTSNWTKISQYITVPSGDSYNWITLGNFGSQENGYYFDDVQIICVGNSSCDNDNYIQNATFHNVGLITYKSQSLTTAGMYVTSLVSPGSVTVDNGSDVLFKSQTCVSLENGFSVDEGAKFTAKIAPCNADCFSPVANAGSDAVSCNGQLVQLGSPAVFGFSYAWSAIPSSALNYLSNPNSANPVFNPPPASSGVITYNLLVSNECGQTASDVVIVKHNSNSATTPSASVSNINYTDLINFDVSCGPLTEVVKIEVLTTSGTVVNTYMYNATLDFTCCSFHWQIPTPMSPCQDYQIMVSAKNICSSTYSTPAVINWTRNRNLSFATPLPNVFTPNGDGVNDVWCFGFTGATSYQMTVNDQWGTNVFSGSGSILPPSACVWNGSGSPVGTYYYTLQIAGCGGSTATSGSIFIASTSSRMAEEDSLKLPQEQVFQIENPVLGSVMIVPNPTDDRINIKLANFEKSASITIMNASGQIVYSTLLTNSETEVDMSAFISGMYFVEIISNGTSDVTKVIKN